MNYPGTQPDHTPPDEKGGISESVLKKAGAPLLLRTGLQPPYSNLNTKDKTCRNEAGKEIYISYNQ